MVFARVRASDVGVMFSAVGNVHVPTSRYSPVGLRLVAVAWSWEMKTPKTKQTERDGNANQQHTSKQETRVLEWFREGVCKKGGSFFCVRFRTSVKVLKKRADSRRATYVSSKSPVHRVEPLIVKHPPHNASSHLSSNRIARVEPKSSNSPAQRVEPPLHRQTRTAQRVKPPIVKQPLTPCRATYRQTSAAQHAEPKRQFN